VASLGDDAEIPKDEWTLCEELVAKYGRDHAEALILEHRRSHVTRDDFVAIRQLGANSVRIPFGYWAISGPRLGEPFVGPCTEFLDSALDWGHELGLSVVLCLHAAIGFQSSDPPCGRNNPLWSPSEFDVDANVNLLRMVVRRFGSHPGLGGICILNEPSGDLPPAVMNKFFRESYDAMRNGEGLPASVQIMLPIFHHEFADFSETYTEQKGYSNVVFDVHCYQVFGDPYAGWCYMSLADHLRYATATRQSHPVACIAQRGERVVVTEFSLAIPTPQRCMIGREFEALSRSEREQLHRSFAMRQLSAFSNYTEGWFFWCWKDDSGPQWSFSEVMARGWMKGFAHEQLKMQHIPELVSSKGMKRVQVQSDQEAVVSKMKSARIAELATPTALSALCTSS
jgi:glucan 1,3-beta-glucosidase